MDKCLKYENCSECKECQTVNELKEENEELKQKIYKMKLLIVGFSHDADVLFFNRKDK